MTLDRHISHAKGPFKGKGDFPVEFLQLKNLHEAYHYRSFRESQLERVKAAIHQLKRRFDEDFSAPPARLVLLRGGGIVWRLAASHLRDQSIFEMCGPIGQSLLRDLPPAARCVFLEYDEHRSRLAMQLKILLTEKRCLTNWINRQRSLLALRKSFCS
jgi:hypothetical protein